jgi:2-methylcitrate dehydratase PrpD
MDDIIEIIVEHVLETHFESFDTESVKHAKNRIMDVIGCLIAGAKGAGCSIALDLVRQWGGREESTILIHGNKAPTHNVAMVNSLMARSYDYEPVEPSIDGVGTPAHISGTTVPTALSVSEQVGASGKELIAALILGDDIASRLIASSGFSFNSGWDNTGTINMFGATAIAGRLHKLDKRQMRNAFGIVLNQMSGSFQNIYDAVHSFKLPMALAARAGILSAEMAGKGFTGIKDPLLSRHGYFALYCQNPNPDILTKDLGKKFYADNTFKPYPSCRGTHAAIDCALHLHRTYGIDSEDISEITVSVTPGAYSTFVGAPFEIGDVPQANATFSIRYTVADVLLRKSIRLEHFTENYIREPKLLDLIQKVVLKPMLPPDKPLATEVEVTMKDGQKFSAYVEVPKGDTIYNPMTKGELIDKFRSNVAFSRTVSNKNAEKALGLIERLEDLYDITEIINALVK